MLLIPPFPGSNPGAPAKFPVVFSPRLPSSSSPPARIALGRPGPPSRSGHWAAIPPAGAPIRSPCSESPLAPSGRLGAMPPKKRSMRARAAGVAPSTLCQLVCQLSGQIDNLFLSRSKRFPARRSAVGDENIREFLVLPVRIELTASPLPRECSTTELRQLIERRRVVPGGRPRPFRTDRES